MNVNWPRVNQRILRKNAKVIEADGATILEPGIRKIVSKYNVDVVDIGFCNDKAAIRVRLMRNVGEKWGIEFDIPRTLVEDANFDGIVKVCEEQAKILAGPNYAQVQEERDMRKAVGDAIKELQC